MSEDLRIVRQRGRLVFFRRLGERTELHVREALAAEVGRGTGVIAGGPVRKVMQVAGIHNVLTKSLGTSNPHNVVKATFAALLSLKDAGQVAETRSKTVEEIQGRSAKTEAKPEKAAGE